MQWNVVHLGVPFLVGFLLGSIPFGLLLTRAAGLGDIRNIGSGNIGATNVLRTGNKKLAAAVLVLDAAKGLAAVLLASTFGPLAAVAAGLGAVLGHMFTPWLSFRGGKGVATTLGVLWGLNWLLGAAACLLWLLCAAVFRYSSLAALISVALAGALSWLLLDWRAALIVTLMVPLVFIRHHENISRLLAGTESKIGQKSEPKPTMGHNNGPTVNAR
ncbi:MAG TPA: glycerol-3-phosphate 1-O-acyltransferase PlsY [Reyranella sp.]|jgi:glycerol-3-phosphate acyltransferase PlsY|nr:glycerol-3-phosphate 1-O-acyltransferase PlsY [Reyranella sp.]